MDYEKEYKDMVQRARELHESGSALTKLQMEIVCPALAESEEEEIRQMIENTLRDAVLSERISETSYWEMLAYLEKQKEQQPAERSEEEQQTISFAIDWLIKMLERTNVPEAKLDIESVIMGLKSLRPQPHWKPSEGQMKCLGNCVNRARIMYNSSTNGYDDYPALSSLYNDLKSL